MMPEPHRKAIQICPGPDNETHEGVKLFALCDDGTIWQLTSIDDVSFEWLQIETIPQP
jgi:hypothetical protein